MFDAVLVLNALERPQLDRKRVRASRPGCGVLTPARTASSSARRARRVLGGVGERGQPERLARAERIDAVLGRQHGDDQHDDGDRERDGGGSQDAAGESAGPVCPSSIHHVADELIAEQGEAARHQDGVGRESMPEESRARTASK